MGSGARNTALKILQSYRRSGFWQDEQLYKEIAVNRLSAPDAALAVRLCIGVIQNQYLLDYYISELSSVAGSKIEPLVRDILRLGLYQLAFLDRIPASAAVNESVAIAKRKTPRAAGFVNALLRKASSLSAYPIPSDQDKLSYLSIVYSFPEWIVRSFFEQFGELQCESLLSHFNQIPPVYLQVNTCRTATDDVCRSLESFGIEYSRHKWLPDCIELQNSGALENLQVFKDGSVYVQDPAARLVTYAAELSPGMTVIDGCAAPGGKSFATAVRMNCDCKILSFDKNVAGVERIASGADRLGLSRCIHAKAADMTERQPELLSSADAVIADVPCSGLGIIGKKPDIKFKSRDDMQELPRLQLEILRSLSAYLKPGGTLVYSTCTLLPRENIEVVCAFLDDDADFSLERFDLPLPGGDAPEGHITLLPHIHGTDGFFIARLRRKNI